MTEVTNYIFGFGVFSLSKRRNPDEKRYGYIYLCDILSKKVQESIITKLFRTCKLAYGEKTLLTEFKLEKGAVLPDHSHPHEQTGYLISERIDLIIEGQTHEAKPGLTAGIFPAMRYTVLWRMRNLS